jgi:hypothetical protein
MKDNGVESKTASKREHTKENANAKNKNKKRIPMFDK